MTDSTSAAPILSLKNLRKHYLVRASTSLAGPVGAIRAVDGVSLDIGAAETVGLVGESGCGKSTLARLIMQLESPLDGETLFEGRNVYRMTRDEARRYRRGVQMIFQDPFSSLNPRTSIVRSVTRAWEINKGIVPRAEHRSRAAELFGRVGLSADRLDSFPHQLSGGQRQRVAIARAIALNPKIIVCDEPVSALDVSIQAQVLDLLGELQKSLGVSYLFISHDLGVVRRIASRVVVMYLGRIVESGSAERIFGRSAHPYTQALLAAVPKVSPRNRTLETRTLLQGDPPNPASPPSGCRFRSRCPRADDLCARIEPVLSPVGATSGHLAACHHPSNP